MKRSTCKTILFIGLIIITIFIINIILMVIFNNSGVENQNYITIMFTIFDIMIFLIPMAIILMIIAWIFWNSEKREQERQEVRQAQLKALNRSKVNVELKGKMRKLK